jgi:peptide/nickel transport system permease protein
VNSLYAVAIRNVPFFARQHPRRHGEPRAPRFRRCGAAVGMSNFRIIASEILPNVLPVIVIAMSTTHRLDDPRGRGPLFSRPRLPAAQADLGSMLAKDASF